jgi:Polyketide cyclase / dehydrase and lipid transport
MAKQAPITERRSLFTMNGSGSRPRLVSIALILSLQYGATYGFLANCPSGQRRAFAVARSPPKLQFPLLQGPASSSTARNVWWYGGSEAVEPVDQDADSCELVAVRIERTSANSRRIYGEISVPAPSRDVWAILTDYNRLSTHVPNLVESKIERITGSGEMGDGQFQCRLYQKGAQKIIGFEFGASVTMDMREIVRARSPSAAPGSVSDERRITFKCADSFFFREFDGEWKVQERMNDVGEVETLLSYVVDVRPKGPVPVAALEWRIREDVPTNLRAVKKAAMAVGYDGVMATRPRKIAAALSQANKQNSSRLSLAKDARGKIHWYKDETMEAYLTD